MLTKKDLDTVVDVYLLIRQMKTKLKPLVEKYEYIDEAYQNVEQLDAMINLVIATNFTKEEEEDNENT